ncbi:MAG: hypothetical protein AAFW70_17840 [Cyanobacteria bacterium J06635_10]
MTEDKQPKISRHAVTEKWRCYQMAETNGWKLVRIEPTGDKLLKWNCIFEGETEFPDYQKEK